MISFASDYIAGAHPEVLKRLVETNMENLTGYGTDIYCESAKKKIKEELKCDGADIYFLVGGTQTNQLVICTMLAEYEGVISPVTGHVNQHEAGAIEYTGHKVLAVEAKDGKIEASTVKTYLSNFYGDENHEHMVFPGMVYISQPTEYGTLYSKDELAALHSVCKEYDIPLYIDGARLGYALASKEADFTLADIAANCDAFYIGGTKVGALCGEAVVFTHNNAPKYFMTRVKQHGAMLAKGRLLGIQFDALFTDNLYLRAGKHAIDMAEKLKEIIKEKGCKVFLESPTNQQFIVMENEALKKFGENIEYSYWEPFDENHTVIRLATSWSTSAQDLEDLAKYL